MAKKIFSLLIVFISLTFFPVEGLSQNFSLFRLYQPGTILLDEDEDGFPERVELTIILPDEPLPEEIALAADIAARVNLESLGLNFDLVVRESEIRNFQQLKNPILIGSRTGIVRKIIQAENLNSVSLKANQGLIAVFRLGSQTGIICLGGTPETLLRTGRAFFLRWPYFWEIWGRQFGHTFEKLEKDLMAFLTERNLHPEMVEVRKLLYTFPPEPSSQPGLDSLNFESMGEISLMTLELNFREDKDLEIAGRAFEQLASERKSGQNTETLAYPGCGQLEFILRTPLKLKRALIPRAGSSRRLLTPGFKETPRMPEKPVEFDLTEIFTVRGLYVDRNSDGIVDGLETSIIIPENFKHPALSLLTTRLVLDTAGSSFPLVYIDREIEKAETLLTPIFIGENSAVQSLIKSGRLKIPELKPGQGLIRTIPSPGGRSDSLFLTAPSPEALAATIKYFSQQFPYLTEFKKGEPEISSVKEEIEKFLDGRNGAAEAFFFDRLMEELKKINRRQPESLEINLLLPVDNPSFAAVVESTLKKELPSTEIKISASSLLQPVPVLSGKREWSWEGDDAVSLISQKLDNIDSEEPVTISVGVSESPSVREKIKQQIEGLVEDKKIRARIEVLSAYKPGFFWLTENILPQLKNKPVSRLLIKFSEVEDSPEKQAKRFYSDPHRWLQELYPVDEILAAHLNLPVEHIMFEKKPAGGEIYEVEAFNSSGRSILKSHFSPRTREIPFIKFLPGWGQVTVTTGWCRISQGNKVLLDTDLKTDLEKFWDCYQEEILQPLYEFVLKKTSSEPTFSKQPYFKRLSVELWLSEPDYRLGLDEEIISSLESLHDEIYFDTLDFLRAITGWSEEDLNLPADASRSSAPGNVTPIIHPSSEGKAPRVSFSLEDFPARKPVMTLRWKIPGQPPAQKSWEFTGIKPKRLRLDELLFDSIKDRLNSVGIWIQLEKEADCRQLASLLEVYQQLRQKNINRQYFSFPGVENLKIKIQCQDLWLEKNISITPEEKTPPRPKNQKAPLKIPDDRIIGPEECLLITESLSRYPEIRSYIAGHSYEGRPVPVLEIYLPRGRYVSIPRLITHKPVLHLTARQHANEVSSTNYSLLFAELLVSDSRAREWLKKFSVVIQPMENPDGAALALELWKNEPFHCLHAGRYSSPGVDIGYQVGLPRPLLPEARVRGRINREWVPDLYLNLHGYPSHEWVQMFSGYTPYLFRDYWIPKGWFTYYRQLSLNIYRPYREAAEELKKILIEEMNASPEIKESNSRFYSRYDRWYRRWSPFVAPLEIYDGLNIFARRQSSSENRLNQRSQMTLVEQTPEVMDETAVGPWLEFLCRQGLTYLRAHARYLSGLTFERDVIEEEVQNRIRIEFHRRRPGSFRQ